MSSSSRNDDASASRTAASVVDDTSAIVLHLRPASDELALAWDLEPGRALCGFTFAPGNTAGLAASDATEVCRECERHPIAMAARCGPCPEWCSAEDCSGWEGRGGEDGRTHRRRFYVQDGPAVEIYSIQFLDGTIYEQGAQTWEHEFMSGDVLRAFAATFIEAADFMRLHGIEVMTSDPARVVVGAS